MHFQGNYAKSSSLKSQATKYLALSLNSIKRVKMVQKIMRGISRPFTQACRKRQAKMSSPPRNSHNLRKKCKNRILSSWSQISASRRFWRRKLGTCSSCKGTCLRHPIRKMMVGIGSCLTVMLKSSISIMTSKRKSMKIQAMMKKVKMK